METMNSKIINFWDTLFQQYEPQKIDTNNLHVENDLDRILKKIGESSDSILEIGTGTGYALLTAFLLGKRPKKIVGFDPAKSSVDFFLKTLELSNIKGFEIYNEDHSFLKRLKSESFDSIMTLNVIDVLEPKTSDEIIKEIKRILKPNGYFFLKINFYLTKDLQERTKMINEYDNVFTHNGVIRAINRTTDEWCEIFKEFSVEEIITYERIPNGPKDRGILFKKQSKSK